MDQLDSRHFKPKHAAFMNSSTMYELSITYLLSTLDHYELINYCITNHY